MATPQNSRHNSASSSPQRKHVIQVDSVQRWMEDLRHMTEVECMCILQSKPIGVDEDVQGELIVGGAGEQGAGGGAGPATACRRC
ncbi:hypothetical protein ANANG_G00202170 [Anguilla anguilla]|uniref:Protein inscuteable homologue LGN-binding domain-containing protein n=1 Tax=Anguilla anguilla TaxID=7936 RepID=A0A9D3RQ87_ANGAN|nr:hypothetical protein ANANG_G00202170 [Anguilla anguilla]